MDNLTNELKSDEEKQEYLRNLVYNYKYDKNLVSLVRSVKDRLKIKWDCVAVIDGEEGVGKSSAAIMFGYLMDSNFDLDKNIAYLPTTAEVEDKFKGLKSEQVLVVDEAIKALYKLRFMDKMQARINTMYATERKQRKVTLLLIPRFTDLNEFFRNDRVQFWIHVVDRGTAVAFVKDKVNIFGSDRWHLKEEYKRICIATYKKKFAEITTEEILKIYEKSQHYWFTFHFPQLPDEVEDEYLRLRETYNGQPARLEKEKKIAHIDKLLEIRQQNPSMKMTTALIADIVGCHIALVDKQIRKNKDLGKTPKDTTIV